MLILLALACRCPSFESIEIVDHTGEVPQNTIEAIRAEVDLFAAQTGLPGVCVDRIVLDEEILHHAGEITGRYNPYGNRIRLKADDPFFALRHELCHGWDYVQGWTSMDQGDLFADFAPSSDLYPTRGQQARESFAMACEEGIPDLNLELALAESCGTEPPDTAARDYLRDEVYPYDETPAREVEILDLLGDPWSLEEALDGWWIREVVGTEQALVLLTVGLRPHGGGLVYRVVQLDPQRRAVLSTTDLPLRDYDDLTLVGGEDEAGLLVHHLERPTQGFRLPVEGGLERRALPELYVWESHQAFMVGEVVWLLDSTRDADDGVGVIRADLSSGEVDLDPLGIADSGWSIYAWQVRTVQGPQISYIDAAGQSQLLDPRTGLSTSSSRTAYGHRALDDEGFLYAEWPSRGPIQALHRDEERERYDQEACEWERTREDWLLYAQGQLWLVEGTDWTLDQPPRVRPVH